MTQSRHVAESLDCALISSPILLGTVVHCTRLACDRSMREARHRECC
jgi:hypothetical protein